MASDMDQYRNETDQQLDQRVTSMNAMKSELLALADKIERDQLSPKEIKTMLHREIEKKVEPLHNHFHQLSNQIKTTKSDIKKSEKRTMQERVSEPRFEGDPDLKYAVSDLEERVTNLESVDLQHVVDQLVERIDNNTVTEQQNE